MPDTPEAEEPTKVLFIDDDEGLRRLVAKDLQRHGCAVATCGSAAEGLQLVGGQRFDAVVLDHFMPGQDGMTALSELRRRDDPPPVIYLTGTDDVRVAVSALKAGAADYVVKDVAGEFFPLLRRSIEGAVEQNRLRRANELAQIAVREARDRAEALLSEVNHRVANSLQLVASLVRLQAAAVSDPTAKHVLRETENRIVAVAQVHKRLYASGDVRFVDAADYLTGLINELAASLEITTARVTVAPAQLRTDMAVSLGVIVSELVTNASKYAYPEDAPGEIRVGLTAREDGSLLLAVEDDGVGFDVSAPSKGSGMGTKIVRTMAASIGSSLDITSGPTGTRVELAFVA